MHHDLATSDVVNRYGFDLRKIDRLVLADRLAAAVNPQERDALEWAADALYALDEGLLTIDEDGKLYVTRL